MIYRLLQNLGPMFLSLLITPLELLEGMRFLMNLKRFILLSTYWFYLFLVRLIAGLLLVILWFKECNELKTNLQIQLEVTEEDDDTAAPLHLSESTNRAIMLIIGFLPGIKVEAIPLLKRTEVINLIFVTSHKVYRHIFMWQKGEGLYEGHSHVTHTALIVLSFTYLCMHVQEPLYLMVDNFVTDIREFSTSVSGCKSPAAIIMFSVSSYPCHFCIYITKIMFSCYFGLNVLTGVWSRHESCCRKDGLVSS